MLTREAAQAANTMRQPASQNSHRTGRSQEDIEGTRLSILGNADAMAQEYKQKDGKKGTIYDLYLHLER